MDTPPPPDYEEKPEDLWYGHYPCVCCQGNGCDKHNPSQTHIYHNNRLLAASKPKPTLTRRLRQQLRPSAQRKEKSVETNDDSDPDSKLAGPALFFSTDLPLDIYSAEAIPPLHESLPYYLSFYHLSCARRSLRHTDTTTLVEELSCYGTSSPSDPGPQFQWRSEIYYENKRFFQYQIIILDVTRQRPLSSPSFTFCRHSTNSIGPIHFYNHNGFEHAKFRRPFKYRSRSRDNRSVLVEGSWNTMDGSYLQSFYCTKCLTDGNVSIMLHGDAVRVYVQVFRALGSGEGRPTNPTRSVWTALLTGKGNPRCDAYRAHYELEKTVKQVAQKLDRPIPSFGTIEDKYFA